MSKFTWTQKASDRFWPKVDKNGSCWLWKGSIGAYGYGTFNAGGGHYAPAHRFAFVETFGDIPSGISVDHICHNRLCVNPDHLRPATHKENVENHRGARKNSKSGIRGVYWHPQRQSWQAQVTHNRKTVSKRFKNRSDAEMWVIETRNRLHTHNDIDRKSA